MDVTVAAVDVVSAYTRVVLHGQFHLVIYKSSHVGTVLIVICIIQYMYMYSVYAPHKMVC